MFSYAFAIDSQPRRVTLVSTRERVYILEQLTEIGGDLTLMGTKGGS